MRFMVDPNVPLIPNHSGVFGWVGNIGSAITIIATLAGLLPAFAATIAIIWYLIQIAESASYKDWRRRRVIRKIALLRRKIVALERTELFDAEDQEALDKARQHVIELERQARIKLPKS